MLLLQYLKGSYWKFKCTIIVFLLSFNLVNCELDRKEKSKWEEKPEKKKKKRFSDLEKGLQLFNKTFLS